MGTSRQRGFTMIELLVALAVLGVMVAIAIPSFESTINGNRLTGAANELMASLQLARMDAVQYNKRAVLCTSDAPNAAAPACSTSANTTGWLVFLDTNKNGTYETASDTLIRASSVNGPVKIRWNSDVGGKVVFRSDGMARKADDSLLNGTIAVCLPTTTPSENIRNVFVAAGSRVSFNKATNGATCSTSYTPPNPTL